MEGVCTHRRGVVLIKRVCIPMTCVPIKGPGVYLLCNGRDVNLWKEGMFTYGQKGVSIKKAPSIALAFN